jgi:hypothetical protein
VDKVHGFGFQGIQNLALGLRVKFSGFRVKI